MAIDKRQEARKRLFSLLDQKTPSDRRYTFADVNAITECLKDMAPGPTRSESLAQRGEHFARVSPFFFEILMKIEVSKEEE
ncbi:MAG: hypothetical protein Q8R08_02145 [bacterium]|nr:hypothetical protein [bacterium]